MSGHVLIFDTTLRDGEQAPGCTMTRAEKLDVARQLARLRVDIIEAGFPAASRGDWDAVHAVASEVGASSEQAPVICGLARANERDIELCWSAIAPAQRQRVHTFLATSDIHLQHKLRMSRDDVLATVSRMVAHARSLCDDVEFSAEDAARSDRSFLHAVLSAAVDAGATTLNIPDTVGYATPDEYFDLIASVRACVPRADALMISTHCHDDLGLAVANSLAGVRAGARQVECTVNGIGERAGNAALEEIAMALHTRRQLFGVETAIDTREIGRASRLVAACTGFRVPPNKAIVGVNAFAHEAGIHQDGVLKHPTTYEIMNANLVGLEGGRLVLGKHSGRHALRKHLETAGHSLSDEEFANVFTRFKEVADRKKLVDDRDIEAIVAVETRRARPVYELDVIQVSCGTHAIPTATVRLRGPDGTLLVAAAQGDGPIDAVCCAINAVVGDLADLVEFTVDPVTEGIDAVGGVTVRLRERANRSGGTDGASGTRGRTVSGFGVHTDVIVATAEAYLSAINSIVRSQADTGAVRIQAPYLTRTGAVATPAVGAVS